MVSLSRQISLIGLTGFALLCLASPVWAVDGRIQDIRYDAATRHFQINSAGNVKATVNTLNIAGHKRIIIDIDNAEIGTELPRDVQLLHTLSRQLPALKNVTVNQYAGNGRPIVRILFDIEGEPGTIRLVRNQGSQIELEFNESANWTARSTYGPSLTPKSWTETPKPVQSEYTDVDLRRTLAIMNQKYDLLAQENQYLKTRLSSLEQNSSAQQSQQQSSREEQTRLKSDLERLRAENNNLQTRLMTLSAEKQRPDPALYAKDSEINRLKTENQSLNSRLTAALSASNESSVSAMKQSLAELNRRYELLVSENQGLKSKLSAQSGQSTSAQTYKAEVERLSQSYQSLLTENNRLKSELSQSKASAAKVPAIKESDLAALRSQLTTAQTSLGESIQTINQQNKEIAFLKNQVNQVKSGLNASSKEQIATLQAEIDTLRKNAAVSKGSSADKQVIEQLRQDKLSMQSELDALRKSAAVSKNGGGDQQRIAQLTQEKLALQSELDALRKSAPASKGKNADRQLIAQLTQEKQSLQSELERLKASQSQGMEASEKADQLQSQVASLQSELSSLKTQYETVRQEATQAKQALKSANSKTTASSGSAKTVSNPSQQKQIQSLTQQVASLKQENSSLRESLSSASASNRKSAPTNAEAEQSYQAGKTALGEKKMSMALDSLKKATLLDQDNSKYVVDYSIALAEDRQFAEAIDILRRYIQRNPGDREAYNQLGKIYLLNDQPDAANQAFTRAIPVSVLNNYATSLKKLGNAAEAESIFKLALSINPKDSEILFNLGNLYNAENKLEEARNKYLEAIQIRPGFAEAHYNLGLIFSKLGDNPKAVQHLEKYLQLSPNARNAETIRAYMQKLKA
jgi:tetratricopeptide (TPR) repeat protein